jgi:hypothetical protein
LVENWEKEADYWLKAAGSSLGSEQGLWIFSVQQHLTLGGDLADNVAVDVTQNLAKAIESWVSSRIQC